MRAMKSRREEAVMTAELLKYLTKQELIEVILDIKRLYKVRDEDLLNSARYALMKLCKR